ncbi:MAG: hypothetical protein ACJAU6_002374 [Alphaproteobacteria bacterium]|jgi:hypothetical protein
MDDTNASSSAQSSPDPFAAIANLYHAYVTGLLMTIVTRRASRAAEDFWYQVFRRQHLDMFLPGLEKLGLSDLPDAVAAAQYHYLSNKIGGVGVEYMYESDRKAWVRFTPPRWIYDGASLCAIPSEVSRALLRGWYGHNGVALGNPRLGFVCTAQAMDAQSGLSGYFREYDHDLSPDEYLIFSPGEEPPRFDSAAAPKPPAGDWPEARLKKAHRNYAMNFVKTSLSVAPALFGPAESGYLGNVAGRLIGMQYYRETAQAMGLDAADDSPAGFAAFLVSVAEAQGDPVETEIQGDSVLVRQRGWRLMRGQSNIADAAFDSWNGLWQGALMAHNRFLVLEVLNRMDYGDDCFCWRIRARGDSQL